MANRIYRDKSIERVASPEELNQYARVISPGVWVFLGAVIALLIGGIIWGIFGRLSTTVSCAVVLEDGSLVGYVNEADGETIVPGLVVRVGEDTYRIQSVQTLPVQLKAEENAYLLHILGQEQDAWLTKLVLQAGDGSGPTESCSSGTILVETISPLSFLVE